MTKVVVAEVAENSGRSLDVEAGILGPGVELVRYSIEGCAADIIAACADADIILTDYAPLNREVIEQLDRCRLISVAATGYNCVDVDAAARAGISVCCIDEYCTHEVADHTILLMLALCRRLLEYHDQVQAEKRWEFDSLSGLRPMHDMTLGLVGFGRIGQAVARRARGFGVTTIAHDPHEPAAARELGVSYCDLPTFLAESDIISLHSNLSADNKHLIDGDAFRQMRKMPFIINCARGGLIDEVALVSALDTQQIAGAGLDVLNDESPDLKRSSLAGRPNVILTPHVAFYSDASMLENRKVSALNIRYFLDGEDTKVQRYVHHATD
jgi:phosphoglycerate dehydrogenase-like enzyme